MSATRKQKGWWIVAGESDRPGKCLTCGEELRLQLPQPIEVFLAASKAFVRVHLRCGPPREGPEARS
jgi:hypothetical protein